MTDTEILDQMIQNNARLNLQHEYGKSLVKLTEPQAPDTYVIIRNLPEDAFILKADAFSSPDAVFNGSKGECKRADYVIISETKKCILYVEIKRNQDLWHQIVNQLKGAWCFIEYCGAIGKTFWEEASFLNGYQHRFISIGKARIDKKKTRIDRDIKIHDTPEKAMKVTNPHYLQFNHIAGLR